MRKRSFSLLELIVVFAILALVVSVVGIKISQAVENTRFQESYKLLTGKIELARTLAKFTQGGISLIIERESQKNAITIYLDGEALPNAKIKNVLKLKEALPGISHISLDSTQNVPYAWPICLIFYPNGICASHLIKLEGTATLEVTSSTGNGTPRKIALSQPPDNNLISEGRDLYPHELKKPD